MKNIYRKARSSHIITIPYHYSFIINISTVFFVTTVKYIRKNNNITLQPSNRWATPLLVDGAWTYGSRSHTNASDGKGCNNANNTKALRTWLLSQALLLELYMHTMIHEYQQQHFWWEWGTASRYVPEGFSKKETSLLPTSTPYSFRCKLLGLNGGEKTWHSANRKNTPAVDDLFLDGSLISLTQTLKNGGWKTTFLLRR